MENIFEPAASAAILQRLQKLQPGTAAQWGKMNVAQMMAHCQVPIVCSLGDRIQRQSLMGMLFDRIAKKQILKDTPFRKNLPTDASFMIKDKWDFEKERQLLRALIQRLAVADPVVTAQRPRPFFGKMTGSELGMLTWKHLDHHLGQLGV
ncbi:MAG: DUF1569 domain-containing protein [Bacteroidota bacterium]